MMIHYNDEAKLEQALEYFKNAYRLAPKRPTPPTAGRRARGLNDAEAIPPRCLSSRSRSRGTGFFVPER